MSYTGMESPTDSTYSESTDRGTSVIDAHSEVEGTYNTSRDLRIEGHLTGSVNCDGVLFVADGAEVDASVEASSIIVSGKLSGTIRCRGRLEITATGSVGGEVETGSLVIVEGARYEGQITMLSGTEPVAEATSAPATKPDEATDSYSLLRRYASAPAESRDDAPATSGSDEDEPT